MSDIVMIRPLRRRQHDDDDDDKERKSLLVRSNSPPIPARLSAGSHSNGTKGTSGGEYSGFQLSFSTVFAFCLGGFIVYLGSGGAGTYLGGETSSTSSDKLRASNNNKNEAGNKNNMKSPIPRQLQISTWNIAAINNNPFEYWITVDDNPAYEKLMVNIEQFIENPGSKDVKVSEVFTQNMFERLDKRLTETAKWASVKSYWENDFSNRAIIKDFMKDDLLGSKRLASMPDRYTNTIDTDDGKKFFRPTVINMYEDDLSTQDIWWNNWEKFMFDTKMKINGADGVEDKIPYQMLQKISKVKYPDISTEEANDSLPLQTMCGAIFDAILVYMMNTVSTPTEWQPLKRQMIENLNKKKIPHTLEILENAYSDSDIITLQEVSSSFVEIAKKSKIIGPKFHIIIPANMDAVRDQNSVILLSKKSFPSGNVYKEVSHLVEAELPAEKKGLVANGDILAIVTENVDGETFVIASFHGDTNGLATIPVTNAVANAMANGKNKEFFPPNHKLIFGLDANTYEVGKPNSKQDVMEYGTSYVSNGFTSCWGDVPQKSNYTTYNARTFLQPQLNKACRQTEKRIKGDVNPKDFILFHKKYFKAVETWKDNTGEKRYIEDMPFPTMKFPSDHGILSTIIEPK